MIPKSGGRGFANCLVSRPSLDRVLNRLCSIEPADGQVGDDFRCYHLQKNQSRRGSENLTSSFEAWAGHPVCRLCAGHVPRPTCPRCGHPDAGLGLALHHRSGLHRVAEVGSLSARTQMATKFSSGAYLLFSRQKRSFCV